MLGVEAFSELMIESSLAHSLLGQSQSDDALSWLFKSGGERYTWVILTFFCHVVDCSCSPNGEAGFLGAVEMCLLFLISEKMVWSFCSSGSNSLLWFCSDEITTSMANQAKKYEGTNCLISHLAVRQVLGVFSRRQEGAGETVLCSSIHTDERKAVSLYNIGGGVPDTLACPIIGFPL